jgi:hypothetical protein
MSGCTTDGGPRADPCMLVLVRRTRGLNVPTVPIFCALAGAGAGGVGVPSVAQTQSDALTDGMGREKPLGWGWAGWTGWQAGGLPAWDGERGWAPARLSRFPDPDGCTNPGGRDWCV